MRITAALPSGSRRRNTASRSASVGCRFLLLADFEREAAVPRPRTIGALSAALEAAGVEFIAENGGGAGVRLREPRGK